MVHRSMENLKLDKRLLGRRGWLEPEDLQRLRESLPDVEEKAERVAVSESAAAPSGDEGEPREPRENPPEVG